MKSLFRTISLLSSALVVFVLLSCSDDHGDSSINLQIVHSDSLGFPWTTYPISRGYRQIPITEQNLVFHPGYEKIKPYYIAVQPEQYYMSIAGQSREDHDKILQVKKQPWFDRFQKQYTTRPVDCVISVCTVKDRNGNELVLVDTNNNQDFSDENPMTYVVDSLVIGQRRPLCTETVETMVKVQFYDGKKIATKWVPLGFRKIYHHMVQPLFTIREVAFGTAVLDGQEYRIGVASTTPGLEYSLTDILWIDINHNGRYDLNDYFTDMADVFTFSGVSYKVSELDRFGEWIKINKMDSLVAPPIDIDKAAPDFELATLDSTRFRLSDQKGKVVILDFWSPTCETCKKEFPFLKKAFARYHDRGLEIVSIGLEEEDMIRYYAKEYGMDWIHIQQWEGCDLQKLYQVRSIPFAFLIDRQGMICGIGKDVSEENLLALLERLFHD